MNMKLRKDNRLFPLLKFILILTIGLDLDPVKGFITVEVVILVKDLGRGLGREVGVGPTQEMLIAIDKDEDPGPEQDQEAVAEVDPEPKHILNHLIAVVADQKANHLIGTKIYLISQDRK